MRVVESPASLSSASIPVPRTARSVSRRSPQTAIPLSTATSTSSGCARRRRHRLQSVTRPQWPGLGLRSSLWVTGTGFPPESTDSPTSFRTLAGDGDDLRRTPQVDDGHGRARPRAADSAPGLDAAGCLHGPEPYRRRLLPHGGADDGPSQGSVCAMRCPRAVSGVRPGAPRGARRLGRNVRSPAPGHSAGPTQVARGLDGALTGQILRVALTVLGTTTRR